MPRTIIDHNNIHQTDINQSKIKPYHQWLWLLLLILTFVHAAAAQTVTTPETQTAAATTQSANLISIKVHSDAISGNLLGDSPDRDVQIYLPPSYQQSPARRYPVLYLLHGYGSHNTVWTDGTHYQQLNIAQVMDAQVAAGRCHEMIIVMPDGHNRNGGSMYTDSITNGGWEQFITHELVQYVDQHYRTLPVAASRGIAGHSMGGYGAIRLAMRHADIYSAVYALSPAFLAVSDELSASSPA